MIIKVGNYKIKKDLRYFLKGKIYSLWHNVGFKVLDDCEWRSCSLGFHQIDDKRIVKIVNIYNKHTNKHYQLDTEKNNSMVSFMTYNLLMLLNYIHPINKMIDRVVDFLSKRRVTTIFFLLAVILSLAFYFVNVQCNNRLIDFIADSPIIQAVLLFITMAGFIKAKQIDKEDIIDVAKEEYEKREREKKIDEYRTY
jgi:hypothetical protein